MAYIANTAFEPRIVNNRFDDLCNIAGLYQTTPGNNADCSAGLLCVRGALTDCEGFPGVKNENSWIMAAAGADATIDTPVYACNTYDTQLLAGKRDGLNYYVGTETLGLGAPAGRYCTFTHIDFDNRSVYRFGIGNLSAALGENKFFTIADGLLVPAASAPATAGSIFFWLQGTGNFTEGTTSSFQYVDVMAMRVSVAG